MTNGGYPTQALIRFADQVQRQVREHEPPFGNLNRMTDSALQADIRAVAKGPEAGASQSSD
jgi:hypothetical protein